jgi:hypothetical protein
VEVIFKTIPWNVLVLSANQKQELPVVAMFVSGLDEMSNLYRAWKVIYKDCSFCPDPITNIATTGNYCF